jgi:sulfoxide reductase heme-binding subunit YedZ
VNPVHDHVWWLLSRSAGVVALLAMTASVILGLTLATRLARPHTKRLAGLHEQLALVSLVAIAVHAEALLGDRFLDAGVLGIAVPFVLDHEPVATGLGVIGAWLATGLGLSFYARRRFGPRRWRQLHRFTVLAWALAVVHALFAGTDAGSAWLRLPLLGSVGVVAALFSARLLGTRSGSRRSSTPRTTASARSPG